MRLFSHMRIYWVKLEMFALSNYSHLHILKLYFEKLILTKTNAIFSVLLNLEIHEKKLLYEQLILQVLFNNFSNFNS